KITSNTTLIEQNADGLKLKANQDTVDTLAGTVQSLGSEFDIVAGQVSSKVWNTDIQSAVDGIEVGGRNYFKGTEFATQYPSRYEFDGERLIIKAVDSSSGDMWKIADLEPNTNYILHFSEPINDRFILPDSVTGKKWENNKKLYFKTDEEESQELRGKFYPIEQTYPQEVYIKLEKGTKATDWTPAPEDTDAKIDYVESEMIQKYDSITTNVSSLDGRVTSVRQDLDSITSTVADSEGRISVVEQNVNGIQETVSDPVNGVVTQVRTLADGFNVLATDMENVEIGGR